MGGTKWNKVGTSEGTYGPVDWDHFSVQKLPSVGSGGAENGQKCAFLAISSSGGPKWVEQSGTRVEQVRGHMGRWVGTFLPFRFCLQWAPEGLNMAKPLPPCLETPAAKNKNPFSVFLGPQIMKKKKV